MRRLIFITTILWTTLCSSSRKTEKGVALANENRNLYLFTTDNTIRTNAAQRKLSVLVMPPFDFIANEGISPDTQKYLEEELSKDTGLTIIKFPYKKLMNVPYQNVFDKKYCKPVVEKIKADKIVMTKLDQVTRTGSMATDKWNVTIRIYDINTDKQKNSQLMFNEMTGAEIRNALAAKRGDLAAEIKNNR